jgi:hypothetical protein
VCGGMAVVKKLGLVNTDKNGVLRLRVDNALLTLRFCQTGR